ncbi:MAG: hypothetical protein ACYC25_02650 [Paludibacter sp.]
MLRNNIKKQSKSENLTIMDLTPSQNEQKIEEMLKELSISFPQYLKKELLNKFTYKGVRFAFGDKLNIFGKTYIVLALLPEEKTVKVIYECDMLKYSNGGFNVIDEGIWISLKKYLLYDDLRNLKKSIAKNK